MPLVIGSMIGGTTSWTDRVKRVWARMSTAAETASARYPSADNLEILFDVPGPMWQPKYSGIRTGRASRGDRRLQIQVAVPESLSTDAEIECFFLEAIAQSALLAKQEAPKRVGIWSGDAIDSIVSEVARGGP
jgi:hypothetical protein